MNIWTAGGVGFIVEGLGVATGIFSLVLLQFKSKRLQGMMMGLAAGLMMAVICFDILPEAFKQGGMVIALVGVVTGLGMGLSLDNMAAMFSHRLSSRQSHNVKTGVMLTMAVALHNIPEGIALGTLLAISPQIGMKVALIVWLHSIPEGMAIAIPLTNAGIKEKTLGVICVLLSTLMAIGAMTGFTISSLSPVWVALAMGFAAGLILYVVCEELMPQSKDIWNGRLTTVAVVFGIIMGIIITIGI